MSKLKRRMKKQSKRCSREHKQLLKEQSERSVVQHFLQSIHVWEDLKRGHIDLTQLLRKRPRIMVQRAPGDLPTAKTDTMVRVLQEAVDDAEFTFPQGYRISVDILWTRLFPALDALCDLGFDCRKAEDLAHHVQALVTPFITRDILGNFAKTVHAATVGFVRRESHIDGVVYYLDLKWRRQSDGREALYLLLHQDKARITSVLVDGKPRVGYWVGFQGHFGEIDWIKWTGAMLNTQQADQEYPVLVQTHVLRRLFDRLGGSFSGPYREAGFHFFLWLSLMEPVFHPYGQDQGCFLVEFRVHGLKLGYLLARIIDDHVLLQTFLFLTMDGTPEGTELWQRLRLSRHDKTYLGLDSIDAFAATDLRKDACLVSLLDQCKCGHLFDDRLAKCQLTPGYAEAMKKHIGPASRLSLLHRQ